MIESQRSPMPSYSWLRTTRVISMGKIYASTVGCPRHTLWFQGNLHELPVSGAHRAFSPTTFLSYIYLGYKTECSHVPFMPFASRTLRAASKLDICTVVSFGSFSALGTSSPGQDLDDGPSTQSTRHSVATIPFSCAADSRL